jgi:hypothetical protein
MEGIFLNIIAYFLMSIGAYISFDYSVENGNKLTQIINYIILMWNIFMFMYLIIDHKIILSQPLNIQLNFFETITNYLVAFWLISFRFTKKQKVWTQS